ncbi:MAG: SDR family NAD(P)-dependent oxidoreductase [Desulfobacter sp.]|nr:SDR family NAD(P)-dependent oxidoreductase [Desulfobacter sp.]
MRLKNKTILIVGASSGIGHRLALELSHFQNRIVVFARRDPLLNHLAAEIRANGSRALVIKGDALDKNSAKAAVIQTMNAFGNIEAAVLNVGDGPPLNMSEATADDISRNMDINYISLVNFMVPLIVQMKKQANGLIVHTNSLAGFLGLPMQGPYSAAKAACRILMDTCRRELKSSGIKFVSVYPGFVATQRVARDGLPSPFEITEQKAAQHIFRAMEKEKSDYLFPFATANLIRLALILPKPLVSWVLKKAVP